MDAGPLPPCEWPADASDAEGCISFSLFRQSLDSCAVLLDGGLCFTMPTQIVDKHGHPLDGDYDPKGDNGCDHRDTPEWKAEHMRHKHTHDGTVSVTPPPGDGETTTTADAPVLLAGSGLPAMPNVAPGEPATTATVGVDQAITQVKSLVPGGADASPALMIGGAATLAVVGAAIKFGPQVLKSRHEARMKELELKQEQQQKEDDSHAKCGVERAALEAKVVALESKLSAIESKSSEEGGLNLGDFDLDDFKQRLEKIEKMVAPPKKRGRPPKGSV